MGKNKKVSNTIKDFINPPDTLDDCLFYGLRLDEDQKNFRDSIWDREKEIVFCNARAGTGKTTIAVGTANLLVRYGIYKKIIYIMSPVQEIRQGYLPGGLSEKSAPYMQPLKDALLKIGEVPDLVIDSEDNIIGRKEGTAYIFCETHTFMRGINLEEAVVIIDEAENFYFDELKKVLTRICSDTSKVIVIGHDGQCDLYKHPERSGFVPYLNAFRDSNDNRVGICKLEKNYRGWVSNFADSVYFNDYSRKGKDNEHEES